MKKIRWILVALIILGAMLVTGYSLTQIEPDVVIAEADAPSVIDRNVSAQATTVEEVQARTIEPRGRPEAIFVDSIVGYQISYPISWTVTILSPGAVLFQAADGLARVTLEMAGSLPPGGLAEFVNRSLPGNELTNRQSLTINGFSAERILTNAGEAKKQMTYFYIDFNSTVYAITGVGEQALIEQVVRSFNSYIDPGPISF
jgi:hypothetical protein